MVFSLYQTDQIFAERSCALLHPKLVVRISCLPEIDEPGFRALHRELVSVVVNLGIGAESEDDIIMLFPPDMMEYGKGSEILGEIFEIPASADFNGKKKALTSVVGSVLRANFPGAAIQCGIRPNSSEIWRS